MILIGSLIVVKYDWFLCHPCALAGDFTNYVLYHVKHGSQYYIRNFIVLIIC